jgi:hypothetical protein
MAQAPKAPKTQDVFIYDDHSRRDPLMPLVTPSGEIVKFSSELSGSDLALEGIMYAPNGKGIAMVNGKLLNVGDDIGPFTVVEITQFTVILSKGEGKIELKLKRGD